MVNGDIQYRLPRSISNGEDVTPSLEGAQRSPASTTTTQHGRIKAYASTGMHSFCILATIKKMVVHTNCGTSSNIGDPSSIRRRRPHHVITTLHDAGFRMIKIKDCIHTVCLLDDNKILASYSFLIRLD